MSAPVYPNLVWEQYFKFKRKFLNFLKQTSIPLSSIGNMDDENDIWLPYKQNCWWKRIKNIYNQNSWKWKESFTILLSYFPDKLISNS